MCKCVCACVRVSVRVWYIAPSDQAIWPRLKSDEDYRLMIAAMSLRHVHIYPSLYMVLPSARVLAGLTGMPAGSGTLTPDTAKSLHE